MSEVKINPDLSIILVGAVINKSISEFKKPFEDCKALLPVDEFLKDLNETTVEYTQKFPNNDINFPPIDIKLLSFIIQKTLFCKFVNVTNDHVVVEIVPNGYDIILKNIVATSTLRYAKFLLHTANEIYKNKIDNDSELSKDQTPQGETEEENVFEKKEKIRSPGSIRENEPEIVNKETTEQPSEKDNHAEIESNQPSLQQEVSPNIEFDGKSVISSEEGANKGMDIDKKENLNNDVLKKHDEINEMEVDEGIEEHNPEEGKEASITKDGAKNENKSPKEAPSEEIETFEAKSSEAKTELSEAEASEAKPSEVEQTEVEPTEAEQSEVEPTEDERPETGSSMKDSQVSPGPDTHRASTPEEITTIKETRKRSKSPAPQQKYKRFQNIAINLLNTISEHRFSSPFLQAVNEKDAPNYYEVIYQPRDLKSILKAIKSKTDEPHYTKINQLEKDIMLMFSNCVMYNRSDDELVKLTRTMRDEINEILKMFKEAEQEIR